MNPAWSSNMRMPTAIASTPMMRAGLKRPSLLAIGHLQGPLGARRLCRLLYINQPSNEAGDDQQQRPPVLDGVPPRHATETEDTKSSKRARHSNHDQRGSGDGVGDCGLELRGRHQKSPYQRSEVSGPEMGSRGVFGE